MERFRRISPPSKAANNTDRDDGPLLDKPTLNPRLLESDRVPSWYAHNSYILSGYRPVTRSVAFCLRSLTYLHNETVNIYSHLIPAAAALLGNYFFSRYFKSQFPNASAADQSVFHIYLTTSIICFSISSSYHTLLCHSAHFSDLWGRLDYLAIVFQILGSFIPGIYIGFYCEPNLQKIYWSVIGSLSLLTGFIVLNPRLQSMKWKNLRLAAFVATGLSAFAPIVHAASIFPYDQLDSQAGLKYYYMEGAVILLGVAFYATHFPESWRPRKFDIWGASHQIFHTSIVFGAIIHIFGILSAYEWNYVNQRCKWT